MNGKFIFIPFGMVFKKYYCSKCGTKLEKEKAHRIVTKDDWDYMAMFFYGGNLYYMTAINNKYIAIAKVLENGSEKVAEFEVPFVFDELSFLACLGGAGFSRISITDGVLSYIIGEYDRVNYGWEYVSSYFLQVVLDYEETEK